jgi:7-cyano-7-deazaguanine synthase in queuosine biosynthesis
LVSGGLDSTLAWHHVKTRPTDDAPDSFTLPVFINYGQPYVGKEWTACDSIFRDEDLQYLEVDLGLDNEASNSFIPTRNLLLACLVNAKYKPDEIYIAGLKDDVVEDKNPQAFEEMSKILTAQSRKPVKVLSPFWHLTKGQIVAQWLRESRPDLLYKTISCYDPVHASFCGNCPACFRWFVAMESNGLRTFDLDEKIILEYLAKIHKYDTNRIFNTIRAVSRFFKSVIVVDIDGVLTNETEGHDYVSRTANNNTIQAVNEMYEYGNLIILHSSRFEIDREITEFWLRDNNVKYHSLILEKLPYDLMFDDKAANLFQRDSNESNSDMRMKAILTHSNFEI